jgi:hypothetical protein
VPQVRARGRANTTDVPSAAKGNTQRSGVADGRELISKMLEYETAAQKKGLDLSCGQFEMLTASERQFYRAELIADYIRLSAGNMGNTQGYFDAALAAFTHKVCDMAIPSHELIGTYLAAVDLVDKEEKLVEVPALKDTVKRTMMQVLQSCVAELSRRAEIDS